MDLLASYSGVPNKFFELVWWRRIVRVNNHGGVGEALQNDYIQISPQRKYARARFVITASFDSTVGWKGGSARQHRPVSTVPNYKPLILS